MRTLLAVLFFCLSAGAEPLFTMDPVLFDLNGDTATLELNLMVQRSSLERRTAGEWMEAGYKGRLRITQGLETLVDTSWTRNDRSSATAEIALTEKIPDQIRLQLAAGVYRYQLSLRDTQSGEAGSKSSRLELPQEPQRLSGIRAGVAAPRVASDGEAFELQGAFMVPYADALYGLGLDQFYGLAEVDPEFSTEQCRWTLKLLGERQNVVESTRWAMLESLLMPESNVPLAVLHQDCSRLPSGAYTIVLELEEDGERWQTSRPIWVKNPDVKAPERSLASDEYDSYGPEELALLWDATQVLASAYEKESWPRMDLEARRGFMREFWRRRDTDPSTELNEAKVMLLARVEEARQRYQEPGREGHLTERGGIYVKYGAPDEVVDDYGTLNARYDFTLGQYGSGSGMGSDNYLGSDHNDFELWIYDRLDGGVDFIFIDEQGFGEYELAHSTKSGEYYDPSWGRKLFR